MLKILFVCHGNTCRSTMAESVMTHMVRKRGLGKRFLIRSAATRNDEIGNPVHHGTVNVLRKHGIPVVPHRAVRMTASDYDGYDYIIGMDGENARDILRILGSDPQGKVHSLLDFTERPRAIADPWYTGNFDETYADVTEGCEALLNRLISEL
ncbi:MAG: low molecular weight phosphotyrosine protein phosphatase [Oscillospiraceae bacterium]|nr:low molecular weight phosphotyrosine protein phosphatase [Oscillospiraceae bacterium]